MEPSLPASVAAAPAGAGWAQLFHVFGAVAYVGGLLAASRLLALLPAAEGTVRTGAAALARRVYLSVAMPGLAVLVMAGLHTFFADPRGVNYMKQPWMHIKLTIVVLLLAVDHMLVLRPLKALALGTADPKPDDAMHRMGFWMVGLLTFVLLMALFVVRPA